MKMKFISVILCLILSLSLLSACWAGEKEDMPKEEKQTEAKAENVDPADFYGCWKYVESDEWIVIGEDGNFAVYDEFEVLITPRPYTVTPDGLYIDVMDFLLYFDDRGVLCTDDGLEMMFSKLPETISEE